MNPPFSIADRFGDGLTLFTPPEPVAGGFSEASVSRLHARAGTFALRGWPAAADPARIRELHRLLAHVARRQVPVAVPLRDRSGDTLVHHRDRWWQIEPWLPGRADFHEIESDSKLAAAMTCLADFHQAARTFMPHDPENAWFGGPQFGVPPSITARLALAHERLLGDERGLLSTAITAGPSDEFATLARRALRETERLAPVILNELRFAASIRVPLQPVLRDVWHDHVLFTGDAVTGLIDAAAARVDTVAADLARLLGSFLERSSPGGATSSSRTTSIQPPSPPGRGAGGEGVPRPSSRTRGRVQKRLPGKRIDAVGTLRSPSIIDTAPSHPTKRPSSRSSIAAASCSPPTPGSAAVICSASRSTRPRSPDSTTSS